MKAEWLIATVAGLAVVFSTNVAAAEIDVDGVVNTAIVPYDTEILKKAAQLVLEPGRYEMKIIRGRFSFGPTFPAEPFAMVYFEGSIKPVNQENAWPLTWQVFHGFEDKFAFDILKTTTVYATFLDRNEKNNSGGVTLSVVARP